LDSSSTAFKSTTTAAIAITAFISITVELQASCLDSLAITHSSPMISSTVANLYHFQLISILILQFTLTILILF